MTFSGKTKAFSQRNPLNFPPPSLFKHPICYLATPLAVHARLFYINPKPNRNGTQSN